MPGDTDAVTAVPAMSGRVLIEARAPRLAADLAARLEVLEDKLDYDDERALADAVAIERAAEALGNLELTLRARLMQSELWQRAGQVAVAARIQWEVNGWAAEHGRGALQARSHWLLATAYRELGDFVAFLEHTLSAVELLDETASPRRRALYLTRLADALKWTGAIEAARERYGQAVQIAVDSDDACLQLLVLNNLAYGEYMAGEAERGWEVVRRMRAVSEASGVPLDSVNFDTIARVQLALGRYADAERTIRAGIDQHTIRGYGENSNLAECLLTLAVAQRHQGLTDQAQATLDACRALCEERSLAEVGVRLLQEQAELQAARGDHAPAFETYKAFHAAEKELVSRQREAQARTRQAMFETAEARREAELFREQARRDPLTGLRNRRYVDENLPILIDQAMTAGTSLLLALVDLDHFKRINDERSHEVGDQVLIAVAELLATAVPVSPIRPAGFAARLGGEEFLLVITRTSPVVTVRRLERLRRLVATHPWGLLTGDLPVTVSIGVTAMRPGSTKADLLARADKYLYAAKHDGRNLVRVDPEIALPERRRYRDRRPPPDQ
jgi:diguanylate cyclase (GGDEF)-like protein